MALMEGDVPMALRIIRDGQLEVVGRMTYEGKLTHSFTAHPKNDPDTNEMIFFGYNIEKKPWCSYGIVSPTGEYKSSIDIGLEHPVMMHDFAITSRYSVFMDHPLELNPKALASGGFLFNFAAEKPSRIGVLPRHSKDAVQDMRWFEFPSGYVFHTVSAYEEGNEVVLIGCRSKSIRLVDSGDTEETDHDFLPILHEYHMNVETGECSESALLEVEEGEEPLHCEFPTIHPGFITHRPRYAYCAEMEGSQFKSCLKIDLLERKLLGRVSFGNRKYGGECVFVPKVNGKAEDDGYLLTFVYNELSDSSEFWVMDAKTMAAEPLAVVDLPERVPHGFHGLWVTEDQINNQKK